MGICYNLKHNHLLIEDGNKEFFKVWKPKPRKTPRKKSKKIKQ